MRSRLSVSQSLAQHSSVSRLDCFTAPLGQARSVLRFVRSRNLFLVGKNFNLCFWAFNTSFFHKLSPFTLLHHFSHQNIFVLISITEVLRFWISNSFLTGIRSFVPTFLSHWKRGGRGIFSVQELYDLYLVRILQNFFIRTFCNPVLKPGFPSLFQHGQPEGIRRGRLCVLPWYGTVSNEDPSIFFRSVDLFVLSDFAHDGPYYAGHVPAGSRGLGPDFICLYRPSGQDCRCGGSSSSSSSSWAIWAVSGSCVPGDSFSPRWSSAVCRRGPTSAGGADPYDGLPSPHAFPEVRKCFVGFSTTSPSAQDQDAITSVLLCHSAFSLELVRTGPRRTCTAGP